uniref:Uncharacterized protein n=1 Tax=Zosterops lateralis melanops TaxID=1220523 RepID=A0A8D2NQE2_ZOSLA
MSDSTRMSAVNSDLSSNLEERMQSPQNLQGQMWHSGYLGDRNWNVIFRRKDESNKFLSRNRGKR